MLRLNVLALPPEFALAFFSDVTRFLAFPAINAISCRLPSPKWQVFGKGRHRIEVCPDGCTEARASKKAHPISSISTNL